MKKDLNRDKDIPVIVCGDFNSKPTSNVYKLITQGQAIEKPLQGRFKILLYI